MENTNPQGSVLSVTDAASVFEGILNEQESQDQPEREEVEAQAEPQEYEQEEEVQPEPEKPRYRVKVDGDEVEVSLDELLNGYSRQSDYQRKTQTLAEQRKAVEAGQARIEEAARLRDTYAQRLQVIEQMLSQSPQEDLQALKENDPIAYSVKVAEQVERERHLAAIRTERQQLTMRQVAEQQNRLRGHLSQESERLKTAIPDLADEVKGEVVRKEIRDFARSIGFNENELSQVYDHRAVLTLYKAMQYDKLQKGRPQVTKKVSEAPKMMRSGATGRQETASDEQFKKMRQSLKKSGNAKDAARIFEQLI